jgi:hypothetical protein
MAKQETTVLKFEDYVEKASRLYNLALEGKFDKVRISVRKRWCTVYLNIDKTKERPQWVGVYDFVGEEHLNFGYTNEDEWKRLEKHLNELGVKL